MHITWEIESYYLEMIDVDDLRVSSTPYIVVEWMQCHSCHFGLLNSLTPNVSSEANNSCPKRIDLALLSNADIFW